MREPCRVCGAQLRGNQCRWLFGACGRRRLAVLLARALGVTELRRDGRGELLCGKCVFLLERVLQCDAEIRQQQEAQAARVHALQAERDQLCMRVRRKYHQNNPPEEEEEEQQGGGDEGRSRSPSAQLEDVQALLELHASISTHLEEERETGSEEVPPQHELSHQRCSQPLPNQDQSPNQLVAVETREREKEAEGLSKAGARARAKWCGSRGSLSEDRPWFSRSYIPRCISPSREYSALVHQRKAQAQAHSQAQTLSLPHRRSVSLQSLQGLASADSACPTPRPIPEGPSVLSDWLQLVRSAQPRPLPHMRVSRIPVLLQPRGPRNRFGYAAARRNTHPITAQVLKEMEEEFNDEYTPIVVEVYNAHRKHRKG